LSFDARQASLAQEFAAQHEGLDFSLASVDRLVGVEPTDGAVAYLGEVLIAEAPGGEWAHLGRTPAITWPLVDGGVSFELTELFGPDLARHAAALVELGRRPTRTPNERLSAPTVHQPPPALVGLVALGVVAIGAVLVAMTFYGGVDHLGRFAFLVMPAAGLGLRAIRSLSRPRTISER
jgi:hypothetical protein